MLACVLLQVVLADTGRWKVRALLACSRCCMSRIVCTLTASFHCCSPWAIVCSSCSDSDSLRGSVDASGALPAADANAAEPVLPVQPVVQGGPLGSGSLMLCADGRQAPPLRLFPPSREARCAAACRLSRARAAPAAAAAAPTPRLSVSWSFSRHTSLLKQLDPTAAASLPGSCPAPPPPAAEALPPAAACATAARCFCCGSSSPR